MAGMRFLREELYISVGGLGFVLVTYISFLSLVLFLPRGASLFPRFLACLQLIALSSRPFVLTLLERQGLTAEDTSVRLLEEFALHAVRYKVFIRPLTGYIGVYIDAFAFNLITAGINNDLIYTFSHIHEDECATV